jgi:hypothetical protein
MFPFIIPSIFFRVPLIFPCTQYTTIKVAPQVDAERGGPRFKEDVVWHGTRLKRRWVFNVSVS